MQSFCHENFKLKYSQYFVEVLILEYVHENFKLKYSQNFLLEFSFSNMYGHGGLARCSAVPGRPGTQT